MIGRVKVLLRGSEANEYDSGTTVVDFTNNLSVFFFCELAKRRRHVAGDLQAGHFLLQVFDHLRDGRFTTSVEVNRHTGSSSSFAKFQSQLRPVNTIGKPGIIEFVQCPSDRLAVRSNNLEPIYSLT